MKNVQWATLLGLVLLVSCSAEHGRAPKGQYEPGGPLDDRGNAATSRALGRPIGSAEPPEGWAAWVDTEKMNPSDLSDRYDAGGAALDPGASPLESVTGRITGVEGDAVQIQPEQGQPISLRLDENPEITLEGSLVSREALVPGTKVLASYRIDDEKPVANTLELVPNGS